MSTANKWMSEFVKQEYTVLCRWQIDEYATLDSRNWK